MSSFNKGKHHSLKGNIILTVVTVLLGCAVITAAVLLFRRIPAVGSMSSGVSQPSSTPAPRVTSSSQAADISHAAGSSSKTAVSSSSATSAPVTSGTFKNALFIGDSFVDGLTIYSNIDADNVIGKNTMTSYSAVNNDYTISGKKQLVVNAASTINPDSIYFLVGSNDLARGRTAKSFAGYYGELITGFQNKCKNAKIYVQSVFPVTAAYEQKAGNGITNAKIDDYNAALKTVCSDKGVTYIDVASVLKGSDGMLPSSLSSDGLHLKKAGYTKWLSYLSSCTGGKSR